MNNKQLIEHLTGGFSTIDCACGYLCEGHKKALSLYLSELENEVERLREAIAAARLP